MSAQNSIKSMQYVHLVCKRAIMCLEIFEVGYLTFNFETFLHFFPTRGDSFLFLKTVWKCTKYKWKDITPAPRLPFLLTSFSLHILGRWYPLRLGWILCLPWSFYKWHRRNTHCAKPLSQRPQTECFQVHLYLLSRKITPQWKRFCQLNWVVSSVWFELLICLTNKNMEYIF